MILILEQNVAAGGQTYGRLMEHLSRLPGIELRVHHEQGAEKSLTEIYLIGNTAGLTLEDMRQLPGVGHVVRVSEDGSRWPPARSRRAAYASAR